VNNGRACSPHSPAQDALTRLTATSNLPHHLAPPRMRAAQRVRYRPPRSRPIHSTNLHSLRNATHPIDSGIRIHLPNLRRGNKLASIPKLSQILAKHLLRTPLQGLLELLARGGFEMRCIVPDYVAGNWSDQFRDAGGEMSLGCFLYIFVTCGESKTSARCGRSRDWVVGGKQKH
jgi:hypothetical protein